jgi:hypothetical protein
MECLEENEVLITMEIKLSVQVGPFLSFDLAPPVVSVALVVEWEEPRHVYKVQRLVYYIIKVLPDYETCYNQVQKLLCAVLTTKHKLFHYFKSHPIYVVMSHGLKEIIRNCITT